MASSGISLGVALRGQQDVYLMSAKETTFFRAVYTRCTNFGMGELHQSTDTNATLGRSNIQTTFSRAGDLMGEVYLQYTLAPIQYLATAPVGMVVTDSADAKVNNNNYFAHYTNGVGYAMMNWVSVRIGQHEFDKQTGEYLFLRDQLSAKSDRQLSENVGYLAASPTEHVALAQAALVPQTMSVPLGFWFNKHVEQALPMIALYWHDVQVLIELKTMAQILEQSMTFQNNAGQLIPAAPTDFQWLCNFYFLDRPERAMFANQKQELVFQQVQYFGDSTVTAAAAQLIMPIRFNHPVVDLTFALQPTAATGQLAGVGGAFTSSTFANNQWLNFDGPEFIASNGFSNLITATSGAVLSSSLIYLAAEPAVGLQIFLNGQQRTEVLPWKYLREVVPSRNLTRIPREAKCAIYSFGIDADDLLSTGTVNFSRLDTAEARINLWGPNNIAGCGALLGTNNAWSDASSTSLVQSSAPLGWAGRAICYARNFNLAKVSLGMMGVKVRCLLLLLLFSLSNQFFPFSSQPERREGAPIRRRRPRPECSRFTCCCRKLNKNLGSLQL